MPNGAHRAYVPWASVRKLLPRPTRVSGRPPAPEPAEAAAEGMRIPLAPQALAMDGTAAFQEMSGMRIPGGGQGRLFPYPLPETWGLGSVDPLDYRHEDGRLIYAPSWWQKITKEVQ